MDGLDVVVNGCQDVAGKGELLVPLEARDREVNPVPGLGPELEACGRECQIVRE